MTELIYIISKLIQFWDDFSTVFYPINFYLPAQVIAGIFFKMVSFFFCAVQNAKENT